MKQGVWVRPYITRTGGVVMGYKRHRPRVVEVSSHFRTGGFVKGYLRNFTFVMPSFRSSTYVRKYKRRRLSK